MAGFHMHLAGLPALCYLATNRCRSQNALLGKQAGLLDLGSCGHRGHVYLVPDINLANPREVLRTLSCLAYRDFGHHCCRLLPS